jgi:hypothetical protein
MANEDKEEREELKSRLTPEQFYVTQKGGTEAPFTGEYVDCKDDGSYSCICCGEVLFTSEAKYDSGSGWPSFWSPLAGDRIRMLEDQSHGMVTGPSPPDCDTASTRRRWISSRLITEIPNEARQNYTFLFGSCCAGSLWARPRR